MTIPNKYLLILLLLGITGSLFFTGVDFNSMIKPQDIKEEKDDFTYNSIIAGNEYLVTSSASLISKIANVVTIQTRVQLDSPENVIDIFGLKQIRCNTSEVRDHTQDGWRNWKPTQTEDSKIISLNQKLKINFCNS